MAAFIRAGYKNWQELLKDAAVCTAWFSARIMQMKEGGNLLSQKLVRPVSNVCDSPVLHSSRTY